LELIECADFFVIVLG